jgi:hypothetical protein
MRKILSLFQRNYETDRLVRDEVVPGAEWVGAGEGRATQKHDGTACMIRGGQLHKRYDVKRGRSTPPGFEPAQEPDPQTGHWPGWVPVGEGPEDKWFRQAIPVDTELPGGTYELCGPKVQGNPEGLEQHTLIPHGSVELSDAPRDFNGLKDFFMMGGKNIEGIVWHHPDGQMVKIKARDFGLKREP